MADDKGIEYATIKKGKDYEVGNPYSIKKTGVADPGGLVGSGFWNKVGSGYGFQYKIGSGSGF